MKKWVHSVAAYLLKPNIWQTLKRDLEKALEKRVLAPA